MKEFRYGISESFTCMDLARALQNFFEEKKMISQIIEKNNYEVMVQAKTKDGYIRKLSGLEKACTVLILVNGRTLTLQVGEGKWMDKLAGAGIGWFIAWPTLISTAYGAYKQAQLPAEIDTFVQSYLSSEPISYVPAEQSSQTCGNFCSACGTPRENNATFCHNCGNKF